MHLAIFSYFNNRLNLLKKQLRNTTSRFRSTTVLVNHLNDFEYISLSLFANVTAIFVCVDCWLIKENCFCQLLYSLFWKSSYSTTCTINLCLVHGTVTLFISTIKHNIIQTNITIINSILMHFIFIFQKLSLLSSLCSLSNNLTCIWLISEIHWRKQIVYISESGFTRYNSKTFQN